MTVIMVSFNMPPSIRHETNILIKIQVKKLLEEY